MKGNILVVHSNNIDEFDFKEKNKTMMETARAMNITLTIKTGESIYSCIDNNKVKSHQGFGNFDYALMFSPDSFLARNLELMGVKVVNSAEAIRLCENKAELYQRLAKYNISTPKTCIFPTMANYNSVQAKDFLCQAIIDLGLPMIVKGWYGNGGQNVYLAKNKEELFAIVDNLKGNQLILQEYILESVGTDIRCFVVKNKLVASVRRQSMDNFRSNVSFGGVVQKYIPTVADEEVAIMATAVTGCNFAVVDILKSINGPVVCEVNTTANITSFESDNDQNIIRHIFKNIK